VELKRSFLGATLTIDRKRACGSGRVGDVMYLLQRWLNWRKFIRRSPDVRPIRGILESSPTYKEACRCRWLNDHVNAISAVDAGSGDDGLKVRMSDGEADGQSRLFEIQIRNN
jgi:hypothetical protein